MSKSRFYLSECAQAASKSPMCFKLGAVMVKGGKVISSGFNHHRPHYDGAEVHRHGHRKPVSMHAEMHAIFSLTGMSPSFRKQEQEEEQKNSTDKEKNSGRRSPKGAPLLKGVFQGPGKKSRTWKKRVKRAASNSSRNTRPRGRGSKSFISSSIESSGDSSAEASGSEDGRETPARSSSPEIPTPVDLGYRGVRWDSRRRDSKMNGADLYVARITKNGCGNARPCWRCLEWCRWAGIKRIFHWNETTNQFDVVKVNNFSADGYETHADNRLFAGLGW
ncbi:hypothetical protein ACEPAF_9128 [Sanghuangporus sanghuang]